MLKSKINFATAKTAIDFEWKVVFPCFPHYWSWNTKWSSACLSFANWASACEHQIGSKLCHFPDFQFGGTSWKHLRVKSISCWSAYILSLCQFDILGKHWNMGNSGRVTHGFCSFCFEMIHCQAGQMEVQSVRLNQRLTRKRFATQAPHTMTIAMNMYSQ